MATTTNFGWETPDDTDLVKDGAAAIRTALGGVDTSFVDLKGGTTGQVLSKASNTDLDFSWTTSSTAVTFVGASASSTTAQSIANNTETTLNWELEDWDTNTFHDNSTNNSRLTIPSGKAGYYQINTFFAWGNNATGSREIIVARNGTTLYYTSPAAASGQAFGQASFIVSANVGDYFTISVYQSSGGSLNAKSVNAASNRFQIAYLGA
jgi:hypothetical protein